MTVWKETGRREETVVPHGTLGGDTLVDQLFQQVREGNGQLEHASSAESVNTTPGLLCNLHLPLTISFRGHV